MDEGELAALVEDIRTGACPADEAIARLRRLPFADLGFARIDHHRQLRQGLPEAVYGPGKTSEQCARIVADLLAAGSGPVILTRASQEQVDATLAVNPDAIVTPAVLEVGQLATLVWRPAEPRAARVVVVTAGTADLPVAGECVATLAAYGIRAELIADCGVAGVHRLLAVVDVIAEADAVIVVAGMEGALASLVGGLTGAPVVAVPTSVGYGASLEGVTALLAMLASCASGITVVGIDNGYGAACAVARLLR
jgi:pyridinium-3,5-biscarboxylic acid mononucleotide synthase